MLRFGIPKRLYFDNGREFTAFDIVRKQRNRRVAKAKKGNVPITIADEDIFRYNQSGKPILPKGWERMFRTYDIQSTA